MAGQVPEARQDGWLTCKDRSRLYHENVSYGDGLADILPGVLAVQGLKRCRHLVDPGGSDIATARCCSMSVTVRPDANRGLARYGFEISTVAPVPAMSGVNYIVGVFSCGVVNVLLSTDESRVHIEHCSILPVEAVGLAGIASRVI